MEYKNKKLILSISVVVLSMLSLLFVNYKLSVPAAIHKSKGSEKIILIDPGHGGIDGGAVSRTGTIEKNINLQISMRLKDLLEKDGFKTMMTRQEDKGLNSDKGSIRNKKREDLSNRCKMKKESNCDMFISIHLNMFPQSQYYGAQVWYAKNDESKILAKLVQENLIKDLNNGNKREEKPALNDYVVLRDSIMPAILVECGFLSNPTEESKLKSEAYQEEVAKSIANSVKMFFDSDANKEEQHKDNQ